MSQISHKQARNMLRQACARYVSHKKEQLNALVAVSTISPKFTFFEEAIGKYAPTPGFNDWIQCNYYSILKYVFRLSDTHSFTEYLHNELYIKPKEEEAQRFPQLKLSQSGVKVFDQHDPAIVLYNLRLLTQLVDFIMNDNDSNWATLKTDGNYQGSDYAYSDDAPLSLKIDKTIQQLREQVSLISSLPKYKSEFYIECIDYRLNELTSGLNSYLKEIAVQELSDILNNDSLSDEEAVNSVEFQLKNHSTLVLLNKNNQSTSEQNLKLLSVIAVLIGVGIFTTLALVAKRLYDTGGSSINFFKPLATNLCEDLEHITQSTKPTF
ncbi:MAG: hypothetical protein P4L79_02545 [Legionella sp.]|uniref:hypothetical protein n=1 Tax=Legionella sp. TaxID=459 RepID=UPI00284B0ED6|nr:hypothetical protein [Legionella sp.]